MSVHTHPYFVLPLDKLELIDEEYGLTRTASKQEAIERAQNEEGQWAILVYGGKVSTRIVTEVKSEYEPARQRATSGDEDDAS